MATCPTILTTRAVLARTQVDPAAGETSLGQADYVPVAGVTWQREVSEESRADVYTPSGTGLPALQTGQRWVVELTTELYRTPITGSLTGWPLAALFRAGPFKLTPPVAPAVGPVVITPAEALCLGVDVQPMTIELIEVGGNRYRSINAIVTDVQFAASPQGRVMVTWSITGEFALPTDAPVASFTPTTALPVVYRQSSLTWGGAPWASTCPSFTFGTGLTSSEIENACASGAPLTIASYETPAELAFAGALSVKESVLPVWNDQAAGRRDALAFNVDAGAMLITLSGGQLTGLQLGEQQRFVAYDLTWQAAPNWSMSIGGTEDPE